LPLQYPEHLLSKLFGGFPLWFGLARADRFWDLYYATSSTGNNRRCVLFVDLSPKQCNFQKLHSLARLCYIMPAHFGMRIVFAGTDHWVTSTGCEKASKVLTLLKCTVQIELLMRYGKYSQALSLLQQLCKNPDALDPPARGLSQGLTGRPSAWQALDLLTQIAREPDADNLTLYHLSTWLLSVCISSCCTSCLNCHCCLRTFPNMPLPSGLLTCMLLVLPRICIKNARGVCKRCFLLFYILLIIILHVSLMTWLGLFFCRLLRKPTAGMGASSDALPL
jgi:hypothetical protein